MSPNKVDVAVYFEGVYIPVSSVSVQTEVGRPPVANITMPYVSKGSSLTITTTVAIFCRYHKDDHKDVPVIDAYKLIFQGEVTAVGVSRVGVNTRYVVSAEAPSLYLNKMPNQFAWAYRKDEYPQAVEDFEFLGLKYGGTGRAFTIRWFTDGTMFQLAGIGEYRHESEAIMNLSSDLYSDYSVPGLKGGESSIDISQSGIQEPSGMGKVGMPRNDGRRYHQGEDYGTNSGAGYGAELYIPYYGCIIGDCSPSAGKIEFEMPDKMHKIRIFHAEDIQGYPKGTVMHAGTMIGRVGQVGTQHPHLHIELWTKSNPNDNYYSIYSYDLGNPSNRHTVKLEKSPENEESQGIYGIYHVWPDCLMRILGKGKYSSGSKPLTYEATKSYSLKDYVFGLIDALSACVDVEDDNSYYMYYANANTRYNIKKNNIVADYPDNAFDIHFGADRQDSYMSHTYGNLSRYRGTMYSHIVGSLSTIGYISYTVLSPMYDKGGDRFREYITTPAFYNHLAPQFNVVDISPDDHVSIMDSGFNTTALKMKSTINHFTVRDLYSPAELADVRIEGGNMEEAGVSFNNNAPSVVASESIYGVNRKVQEISYFYETALKNSSSPSVGGSVKNMAQRLCDMSRKVNISGTRSVSANLSGLNLNIVAGLPGMVHCPVIGKDYFGMISRVSHSIDLVSGYCSTSVSMVNASSRAQEGGVSPLSDIDESISKNLNDFYRDNFYGGEEDSVYYVTNHGSGLVNMDTLQHTDRTLCCMRDYLTINKHRALIDDTHKMPIDGYTDILDITNFTTTSDGHDAKPIKTIDSNATDTLKIDKISDLYILEKYNMALRMAGDIMSSGRVIQTEGE